MILLLIAFVIKSNTDTVKFTNHTFTKSIHLTASHYLFSGTTTINKNVKVSIDSSNLSFSANAVVLVKGNLKINKSYFHACSAMWEGVYLYNGSKLVIHQCTIEDAKRAFVDTLGANSISIENNWFNKNYESIILKATNTTSKLLIARNVFSCNHIPAQYRVAPVPLWHGIVSETTIGALPQCISLPPYSKQSYSGITLFQTKTPSNSSQYVQIDNYNLFDKLQFGIVATRSKFVIQKNTFQNMASPLTSSLQAGIYLNGSLCSASLLSPVLDAKIGGVELQANTFYKCVYGVFNQYAGNLTITNNNFKYNSTAILITKNNKNKLVTVNHNKINETRVGVLCYDNISINVQITENTLLNTTPIGAYNSNTGFIISEVVGTPEDAKYKVYNNLITDYYNGVYATNTYSTLISNNEIHLIPSDVVGNYQFGIRYENTNLITLLNNKIDKPNIDYTAPWQYGIYGHTNITPRIFCNSINNMFTSIAFKSLNLTSSGFGIIGNVLSNGHFGILLDDFGEIGNQSFLNFASDNQWYGFNELHPQTFTSIGSNKSPIASAIFTKKNIPANPYYLNNRNTSTDGEFYAQPLFGNYTLASLGVSCDDSFTKPTILMQQAQNIATNKMGYMGNESNMNAIGHRQLLYNIKLNHINVSANPLLNNFVANCYSTSTGQFYLVDSTLIQAITTNNDSILHHANLLNNSIFNSGNFVYNKQTVNNIYMSLLNTEPDSTTLDDLRRLAQKCPNLDGDAVFQARALLCFYDDKTYMSICEDLSHPFFSSTRLAYIKTENKPITKTITVSPNLITKNIIVEYKKDADKEPAVLTVYNQIGELVLSKILLDNKTIISIENLSAGIYLYTIKQQYEILKTNKLIIIYP